ncbi:hypothetical protein J5J86_08530 [Aquabacter sp. L1I39]|uniref:hypothetical protein n=1 Tax=Aquabacter sp. L1I39 TaxID=2820278 RepID=UPI001ADAE876|nr:hypothetical protein [Aquabacter sp. L1I39]QTL05317.1 hypothetical protein J5J86_08530 [Aquabacter sp. L1I39]
MAETGLAIVECRWWSVGNDSVRPLFETLAGIVEGNPHDIRYYMFADRSSLNCILGEIGNDKLVHSIYIATHGNETELSGLNETKISRTELRNSIRNYNSKGHIKGLYFGSCLIANKKNAEFLLLEGGTRLSWIAGYEQSVDWIDSSAIDMIFWSKYLEERKKHRSKKGPNSKKSEIQMVRDAAKEMKNLMPSIFTQMGFNIYFVSNNASVDSVW